jgi:hypothetical protein
MSNFKPAALVSGKVAMWRQISASEPVDAMVTVCSAAAVSVLAASVAGASGLLQPLKQQINPAQFLEFFHFSSRLSIQTRLNLAEQ